MSDGANTIESYFSLVKSDAGAPGQCTALLPVLIQGFLYGVLCCIYYVVPESSLASSAGGESVEDRMWEVFPGWAEGGTHLHEFHCLELSHMAQSKRRL